MNITHYIKYTDNNWIYHIFYSNDKKAQIPSAAFQSSNQAVMR